MAGLVVPSLSVEAVEPRGVVDQDLAPGGGIGRPDRERAQESRVVDRVKEARGRSPCFAAGRGGIGMRPVGAPEDPIRVGGDQRFGERKDIGVIGAAFDAR